MNRIGVVGAGTMGNGIAQVFAQQGTAVTLVDVADAVVKKAMAGIEKSVRKIAEKAGKDPNAAATEVLGRIATATTVDVLAGCDLVVEAVFEDLEAKRQILPKLDAVLKEPAILATNTSSISITKLAAMTKRPDRVIGMHFMNPVPIMQLVEIIRGQLTSDATANTVVEMVKALGKTPVPANDYPGFIVNRVLLPMINEAVFVLMEGVAAAADIDQAMKLGTNQPMGPLALADLIGLDVCLAIMEVLHRELGDSKYRPCPLLKRMVAAGLLGRKTKRGFYQY
jgi:3-hydroxybutyryl-CoA dehydrogenase